MMEIHILLAGTQIGPFTEQQVREYLVDGLVSPTDLATHAGMEGWEPVETVLAHLPLPDAEPEVAPSEPDLFPQATPVVSPPAASPAAFDLGPVFVPPNRVKRKPKATKIVIQEILPLTPAPQLSKKEQAAKVASNIKLSTVIARQAAAPLPEVSAPPVPPPSPTEPPVPAPEPMALLPETSAPIASEPPPAVDNEVKLLPPPISQPLPKAQFKRKRKNLLNTPLGQMQPVVVYSAVGLVLIIVVLSALAYFLTGGLPQKLGQPGVTAQTTNAVNPTAANGPANNTSAVAPDIIPKTAVDFTDRGFARQAKGDIDGAITDYNTAINLDPRYTRAYYQQGLARQSKSDWAGALADYNQVLSLDPRHSGAYSNRAFVKQSTGDSDGAIADYTQALLIDPKLVPAYLNRGLIKEQRQDQDGAILDFNHALELDPNMAKAYFNRANAKNALNDLDGAIADYTQALNLNPKIDLAYCNRGFARQSKGDLDGALGDYNQALALNPDLAVAYYNRGLIKEQKGDLDGAIADSSHAIDLNPKDAQSYCNRGLARLGIDDLDGATTDLRTFCDLAPTDPDADSAHLYLWLISTGQNPNGHANQELSDALLNNWNSPPADFTAQVAKFLLGRLAEKDFINSVTSTASDQTLLCKAWYFAGMKRYLAGDKAMATEYFRQAVANNGGGSCEYIFAQAKLNQLQREMPAPSKNSGPKTAKKDPGNP